MPDKNRATISTHFARVAITRAVALGCDQQELLASARLTTELLADHRTRITPAQLGALYRLIWQRLDDELFGFGAASHRHGMFALMARHTTRCTNLREALGYSVQFYNLMSPAMRWQQSESAHRVQLSLRLLQSEIDSQHFVEEFMLLVWHRYFNWLIGARMPLLETTFRFERPAHAIEHGIMFPGPVYYEAGISAISFPARFLVQPVLRDRLELRRYLQHLPDEWFVKQVFEHSLVDRIYHALMDADAQELPDMKSLAALWRTTTRTLHRHLQQESSSFRQIRDQVRRDKAIGWLLDDSCQVGEVARRLGMTEPAFSRAFKNWTGLSPLVYRRSRNGALQAG